jgi:hypothetical protein
VAAPHALVIEGMHQVAIVEHEPESVGLELAEVGHHGNVDVLDSLLMQRARQMMMIDHIVAILRPKHDRDHVLAEELGAFLGALLAPVLALFLDLPHPDGDLGRSQLLDRKRFDPGFTNVCHGC